MDNPCANTGSSELWLNDYVEEECLIHPVGEYPCKCNQIVILIDVGKDEVR